MFDRFLDWFERHKVGVIGTLMLHTFLMFGLAVMRLQDEAPEDMVAEAELDVLPPMTDEEFRLVEQQLAEGMNAEEVMSLVSNITAQRTASTWPSRATQERMSEAIEQDLRNMEQAEFDRLAQERRDRGEEVVVPELDPSKWNKELYMKKAAEPVKVQGNAAVWHDLKDRIEHRLDVPAYTCRGTGQVAVKVAVDRDGSVRRCEVDPDNTTATEDCMLEHALLSSRSARFDPSPSAEDPQRGTIYYVFIAQ